MPIENFFAYAILRAALFSAASPAERLRSAGSLATNRNSDMCEIIQINLDWINLDLDLDGNEISTKKEITV